MRVLLSNKMIALLLCIWVGYLMLGDGWNITEAACCPYDTYTVSIMHGKYLVRALISSEDSSQSYCCARAHLHAVVDMMHYFDFLAQTKKQAFCEGTFIIEDESGRIYDFLKSYANTYRRISSHFNEYDVPHYGLDIPWSKRRRILFPQRKRHILFAQLDHHTLFIKPENYGTNLAIPTDMIMHCKEYVQYLVRGYMRLGFERNGWREERIPEEVTRIWHHFLRHWIDDVQRIVHLVHASTIYGIKSIMHHLPAIYQAVEQPTVIQKAAHTRLMYTLEHYDHCHIRRGSEVILRTVDFLA